MQLKVYDYWRSSASYRLRIALEIKGAAFERVNIDLHPDVMEHKGDTFRRLNPQMRVPAVEIDGQVVGQSMAIIEWIEETWPKPSLFPVDPVERLKARAFADIIACDVHPLNNPSVLNVLRAQFGADAGAISKWYADWITRGFTALEHMIEGRSSAFAYGDTPTIAEICLIPQIYNARRFEVDLSPFPALLLLDETCSQLAAFRAASPQALSGH